MVHRRKGVAVVPEELLYTKDHEWLRRESDGTIVFGITDFAQDALGDIVYVDLPAVGSILTAGDPCGEVESTKSVSELYAPVSGEVLQINENLSAAPDTVNADPYGAGWMVTVQPTSEADTMDAQGYQIHISEA